MIAMIAAAPNTSAGSNTKNSSAPSCGAIAVARCIACTIACIVALT